MAWLVQVKTRWQWVGWPVLVLALGGAVWAYRHANQAKGQADPEVARRRGQPIPVRTARVTAGRAEQVIGATAVTTASEKALIRLGPSNGIKVSDVVVKEVHVAEGDAVRKGQPLFTLDSTVYAETAKKAEAAFTAARAELARVEKQVTYNEYLRKLDLESAREGLNFRQEDLTYHKKALEIYETLFQKKYSSTPEYYSARSKEADARFQLAEARRRLQQVTNAQTVGKLRDEQDLAKARSDFEAARVGLEVARHDLARCVVRSPLDGFSDRVEIVPGSVIGESSALTTILKLDPLHVRVDFPQDRMDRVHVGQKAEVVLDSFPNEVLQGLVIRVSPHVKPELRVFPVVVRLNNPGSRIKAGVSGYVRIRSVKQGLTVPSSAVLEQDGKMAVFRVEKGRARLRPVQAGPALADGTREVLHGLAEGDEVVIFHNFYRHAAELIKGNGYLKDNDPVDGDWRKWVRRD